MYTDPSRKHPLNTRVICVGELGSMSKNNLRGITLVRGPHMGHSLSSLDILFQILITHYS